MRATFIIVFVLLSFSAFMQQPVDEAIVRTIIFALTLAGLYALTRAIVRIIRHIFK